jgi:hypothetical protein
MFIRCIAQAGNEVCSLSYGREPMSELERTETISEEYENIYIEDRIATRSKKCYSYLYSRQRDG